MVAMASQIASLKIVYWTVYSDADQRKHQSSASLAILRGNPPAEKVSIWLRLQDGVYTYNLNANSPIYVKILPYFSGTNMIGGQAQLWASHGGDWR